jgi:hypothetical protein
LKKDYPHAEINPLVDKISDSRENVEIKLQNNFVEVSGMLTKK